MSMSFKKSVIPDSEVEQLAVKKRFNSQSNVFNSLPTEIMIKIFCEIDSGNLFELKYICKIWYELIKNILDIKRIEVSSEREAEATTMFSSREGALFFSVYRAPYIIANVVSDLVIATIVKSYCDINDWDKGVIEELYANAYNIADSRRDSDSLVWKCLLSITGLDEEYKVEELLDDDTFDRFQKLPCMAQYKFYSLMTCFGPAGEFYDAAGVVVLYPDLRTFAILCYTDIIDL